MALNAWNAGSGYGDVVTAPYVAIDPEALLIRMRVHTSLWHVIDPERQITWCGLFLSQGSERRPLSETPEHRRCGTCVSRFEESAVGHPDDRPKDENSES